MNTTVNYGLYVTDDSSEKFIDWRKSINSETNSNMTKIDSILFKKAGKSSSLSVTLCVDDWIGNESPYSQTVEVIGLKAEQNGTVSVAQTANKEQREAARAAMLSVTGQYDNEIIISADGDLPTIDIPVSIIMLD